MDVTCERCGTEYDFDETLVSERGTTVKCTNCGHLFKVFKKGASATADVTARPWLVRRGDSAPEVIATLRDLQKRITEGALSPDDEISRSGEGWKKLGTIAELDTFFAASRAASIAPRNDSAFSLAPRAPFGHSPSNRPPSIRNAEGALASTVVDDVAKFQVPRAPRPPSMDTGKQTVMGVGPSSTPPPRSAPPPPRSVPPPPSPPRGKGTLLGVGSTPPPRPTPSRPPPPTAEITIYDDDRTDAGKPSTKKTQQNSPPVSRAAPPRAASVRPILLDEEERTEMQPRRAKSGATSWLTAFFAALLLGGVVAFVWFKLRPDPNAANDSTRVRILHDGDARVREDDDTAYNDAILVYARIQAFDANDVHALASISRVHALWAQALAFDADDLEARAAGDATQRPLVERVRSESRTHANEAKRYADLAMHAQPGDAAARLAIADASRLLGDLTGAQSSFALAGGDSQEASAEALRVGALLAMDRAGHHVADARPLAARAVEKDAGLAPAQMLLARAYLAEGNIAGARTAVDAVLSAHPQHARAQALKEAMDRGLPPAAPVLIAGDAGVADATAGAGALNEEPVPAGRDYDFYVTQGETLLANHATHRARGFFEAALRLRANDARATTGLGFIAMNSHDYATAAQQFQIASDAGSAEAMIGLGEAYRHLARDADALRVYQRYLQRGGPEAAIARHWVEVLTEALHGPGASPPALDAPSPQPAPAPTPSPTDDSAESGPAPTPAPSPETPETQPTL